MPAHHFTRREREVADLLLEGHSNKEIAARLVLERQSVRFHVSSIYRKLGVHTRADAIALLRGQSYTSAHGNH